MMKRFKGNHHGQVAPMMYALLFVLTAGGIHYALQHRLKTTATRQIANLNRVEGFYAGETVALSQLANHVNQSPVTLSTSPVALPADALRRMGASVQTYSKVDASSNIVSYCSQVQFPPSNVVNHTCMVIYPPTANLSVDQVSVSNGSTVTLNWQSNYARDCTLSSSPSASLDCTNGCNTLMGTKSSQPLTADTTFTLNCTGFSNLTLSPAPSVTVSVGAASPSPSASASPSPAPCPYNYLGACWRKTNTYAVSCNTVCAPFGGVKPTALVQSQCLSVIQTLQPGFSVTGVLPGGIGNNCGYYQCSRTATCFFWPVGGPRIVCGARQVQRPECGTYPPGTPNYDASVSGVVSGYQTLVCPCNG